MLPMVPATDLQIRQTSKSQTDPPSRAIPDQNPAPQTRGHYVPRQDLAHSVQEAASGSAPCDALERYHRKR